MKGEQDFLFTYNWYDFYLPRFSIVKNLFESLPLESNTNPHGQPLSGKVIRVAL